MKKKMDLESWINERLLEISTKLPTLVHSEPASFSCGYNTGYKHAVLDLERYIEDKKYNTKWVKGFRKK